MNLENFKKLLSQILCDINKLKEDVSESNITIINEGDEYNNVTNIEFTGDVTITQEGDTIIINVDGGGGTPYTLTIQDEGFEIDPEVTQINFEGNIVEVTQVEPGKVLVTINETPQVQSDWEETDIDSPAFIKNKPLVNPLVIEDEGIEVEPDANKMNFVGLDVFTESTAPGEVTVDIEAPVSPDPSNTLTRLSNGDLYTAGFNQDGLISGGLITWAQDYTYDVTAATYRINGIFYQTQTTQVTLSPADATHNRIDVIAVDTNEQVIVIEGVPSATPLEPSIDPEFNIKLGFVIVEANTTQPSIIPQDWIYRENTEWTPSIVAGSTPSFVSFNSTLAPFAGSLHVYTAEMLQRDAFMFTRSVPVDSANFKALVFKIKAGLRWTQRTSMTITFKLAGNTVGRRVVFKDGSYGFDSFNTSGYQHIGIPLSEFNLTGDIDSVTFACVGGPTSTMRLLSFDDIQLQNSQITVNETTTLLKIKDEGVVVDTSVTEMNFVGSNVTVTQTAPNTVEVNVTGAPPSNPAWELTGNSGTVPGTNFLGTVDNQPLSIYTNNTERIYIANSGNIGINTNTPSAPLEIFNAVNFATVIGLKVKNLPSTSGNSVIEIIGGSMSQQRSVMVSDKGISSTDALELNPNRLGTISDNVIGVSPSNSYINFNVSSYLAGPSGYGFRDNAGVMEYKNLSGVWTPFGGSPAWELLGNAGTDELVNFVGTTDNEPLSIRTNNVRRFSIANNYAGLNTFDPNVNSAPGGGFYVNAGNKLNPGAVTYPGANIAISGGHLGEGALSSITGGYWNIAIGDESGDSLTSGHNNTLLGYRAGVALTTAYNNVFLGQQVARLSTTPFGSVGIGGFALEENVNGYVNVAIGGEAMRYSVSGNDNVAVGWFALRGNNGQTPMRNVAIGSGTAQRSNSDNVMIGYQQGYYSGLGSNRNTAVGGLQNGWQGGITGDASENTVLGWWAGFEGITGNRNILIGVEAAASSNFGQRVSGDDNIIIGNRTGSYTQGSNNNIAIGNYIANPGGIGGDNSLNIGNILYGTGVYAGPTISSTPVSAGRIGIKTASPTTTLHIVSEAADTSGLRLQNLTSASPTSTGQAIGVDANGNVVTITAGGGGGFTTADNGLTANTSSNVRLGGTLSQATTISAPFLLSLTGTVGNNSGVMSILSQSNSSGLSVSNVGTGNAVSFGGNSSATTAIIQNLSGGNVNALYAASAGTSDTSSSSAGYFINLNNNTNGIIEVLSVVREGYSNLVSGAGLSIGMYLDTSTGASNAPLLSSKIQSKWTDATFPFVTSEFSIIGVNSGSQQTHLTLKGTGQLQLNRYLTTSSFTGTPVGYLAFDSSGNILTTTAPGGGSITADNGLTANTSTNVRLGGTLMQNTTIDNSTYSLGIYTQNEYGLFIQQNSSVANNSPAFSVTRSASVVSNAPLVMLQGSSNDFINKVLEINSSSTFGSAINISAVKAGIGIISNNYRQDTLNDLKVMSIERAGVDWALIPAAGFGLRKDYYLANSTGTGDLQAAYQIFKYRSVSGSSYDVQYDVQLRGITGGDAIYSFTGEGLVILSKGLKDYADDAAAATGGIPVNGLYRTGSTVKIRVA